MTEILKGLNFAEVRLDAMDATVSEVKSLFSGPQRLIATCRPGRHTDGRRQELLVAAIEAGAAYVDVELDSPTTWRNMIVKRAHVRACQVIVSHHDYHGTPSRAVLEGIIKRCFECGASIAKIACTVSDHRENARILGLLDSDRPIIAIGMGAKGTLSRIAGPLLGSPFTYASPAEGRETAEGQLDVASMGRYLAAFMGKEPS